MECNGDMFCRQRGGWHCQRVVEIDLEPEEVHQGGWDQVKVMILKKNNVGTTKHMCNSHSEILLKIHSFISFQF